MNFFWLLLPLAYWKASTIVPATSSVSHQKEVPDMNTRWKISACDRIESNAFLYQKIPLLLTYYKMRYYSNYEIQSTQLLLKIVKTILLLRQRGSYIAMALLQATIGDFKTIGRKLFGCQYSSQLRLHQLRADRVIIFPRSKAAEFN